MENNELPDFLRFNKHGSILTPEERRHLADLRGVCITCGRATHKVTAFRRKPLNGPDVRDGTCLICNPDYEPRLPQSASVSRFNKHGSILTPEERRRLADSRGVCITCGRATHKLTPFGRKPMNGTDLRDGTCLICNPDYKPRVPQSPSTSKNDLRLFAKSLKIVPKPISAANGARHRSAPDIDEDRPSDLTRETVKRQTSAPTGANDSQQDAWDILESMRSNAQNIPLLTRKCHELGNLPSISTGSMYEIIDVMNRFPKECDLQSAGLLALWSLMVMGGDDVKMEACNADVLCVVTQALTELNQDNCSCWCMGLLSCLAEGLGVRAVMLENEMISVIERMLSQCLEGETYNVELMYWTLRCLVSLLVTSKEHDDYVKIGNFESDCEFLEDLEAIDDIRGVLLKGGTLHNALLAIQEADEMDTMNLLVGMKFVACLFSGRDLIEINDKDMALLAQLCQKAVTCNQHHYFPLLKNLACACLCFLLNNDSIEKSIDIIEQSGWVDGFSNAAVDLLQVKQQKDEVVRDIMICTLSHIYYCHKTIKDFPHSNSILKACVAMMTKEKANKFIQETGMWILWGTLSDVHEVNLSETLVRDVIDLIGEKLEFAEEGASVSRIGIVTLGTAILAHISYWHKISEPEIILAILKVQFEFSENKAIIAEANQFLVNACKSKTMAALIESKTVEATSIELRYAIAVRTGNIYYSIKELNDGINAWQESGRDPLVASKILFLIANKPNNTTTSSRSKQYSREIWSVPIKFIADILENITDEPLQNYACAALCSVVATSQYTKNSLDVSKVVDTILAAPYNGLQQLHALWILLTLDTEISLSSFDDLALFLLNAISANNFNRDIVFAAIAMLSIVLTKTRLILHAKRATVERAIGAIIRVMYKCLDHSNDPQIFFYGLRCLRLCSVDAFLHDCIIKEGGIVAIIDGMNVNYSDIRIQEEGCDVIHQIASGSIETKMLIIEADGVDVVLNMLSSHGTNARLAEKAFDILCFLSISRDLRVFIASQGGLILVTSSMNSLESDSVVQEKGLRALATLVSDIDDGLIEMSNITSAVSSTVFNHLAEGIVQEIGITILKNLSKRGDSIREKLLASSCCETVLTAMTIHMTRPKVISSSFAILLNLYDIKESMQSMNDQTLRLFCHAMMVNLQCQKTQMSGCKLLCSALSFIEITTGTTFVEAVVYAMIYHSKSESIQLSGCIFLSACSYHFRYIKHSSDLDSMIVEAVISSMENFPSRPKLQEQAMMALESFLPHQKLLDALRLRSSRVLHVVHEAMTLSDSMDCFERGSDIVRVCRLTR